MPEGEGWWYEPKFDGDRAVIWRRDTVRVQTRAGRDATQQWLDLATAAMNLPADTVLNGEAVIWRAGRIDFGAVRSHASSRGRRLADLAHRYPASYAECRDSLPVLQLLAALLVSAALALSLPPGCAFWRNRSRSGGCRRQRPVEGC
nr:hypothetical protein [Streptomyces sp. SID8367]